MGRGQGPAKCNCWETKWMLGKKPKICATALKLGASASYIRPVSTVWSVSYLRLPWHIILFFRNGNALKFTGNPNIQVYTTPNRQLRYMCFFFFLIKELNISTKVDHFYRNLFLPARFYTLHIHVSISNRIVALCVVVILILGSMNKLLLFSLNCMTFYF